MCRFGRACGIPVGAHDHVWTRITKEGTEMTFSRFAGLIAVGSLALPAADASAQSIGDAEVAFTEGRFLEAADIAEALGTSDGYALAAKSLAVYGHYVATEEDDRDEVIDRAIRMGEEVVRADSTNAEAYFQSAHAVGRYAQTVGTMTALRKGLGDVRGEPGGCHRPLRAYHGT